MINWALNTPALAVVFFFFFTNESNDFERFTDVLGRKKSDNVCHEFEH